jgi:hypothetical protein
VISQREQWKEQIMTLRTISHLPINQSGQRIHDSFDLDSKRKVIIFKIKLRVAAEISNRPGTHKFFQASPRWINTFLRNTQGEKAADIIQPQRPDLLFHQHSKPWRAIAEEYLSDCRDHCKRFLDNLTITILEPELRQVAKQLQENNWTNFLRSACRKLWPSVASWKRIV